MSDYEAGRTSVQTRCLLDWAAEGMVFSLLEMSSLTAGLGGRDEVLSKADEDEETRRLNNQTGDHVCTLIVVK